MLVDLELHQPIPPDTAASVFWAPNDLATVTAGCDSSLFDGISDDAIEDFGLDPVSVHALQPHMPLRPDVTAEELGRLTYWYITSFFNKELKGERKFDKYLKDSKRNRQLNPLVDFSVNCIFQPAHPLDLVAGDKITFIPNGSDYAVTFSSGNVLYDKGSNNLNLGDDDQADLALGFFLPIPGAEAVDLISVNSNGGVSSLFGIAWYGTPWTMRYEMLFGDMAGIGADYSPEWIGQIGIASGKARASELRDGEVDFTTLTAPASLPASAIFEQFTGGSGVPCGKH